MLIQARRVVSVLEHEIVPVFDDARDADGYADAWFTEHDAIALLGTNEIRRGFCQRVPAGIKLAQHCGVLQLPSCVLEVLPKIGFDDIRAPDEVSSARGALLTMLRTTGRVPVTALGTVGQTLTSAFLLDIFIRAFLTSALMQARRGLLSRYVLHREDLNLVRGRFDAPTHFRRNVGRPHLVHCEYDEFTADNPFNRAIRATLDACKPWIVEAKTEHLWFETHTRFASVTATRMRSKDVESLLPLDRTTRRYDDVLTWCTWLLDLQSPSLQAGNAPAPGLLFDMNKLFEAYVASLVENESADGELVQRQGPFSSLGQIGGIPVFRLKPDVTVRRRDLEGSEPCIGQIIDAKWKRLKPGAEDLGVHGADIYQILAYAIRYECDELTLAYPMTSGLADVEPKVFEILAGARSIKIHVRLVRLWS